MTDTTRSEASIPAPGQVSEKTCDHGDIEYSREHDNYYCGKCRKGMGNAYYALAQKYEALQTSQTASVGEDRDLSALDREELELVVRCQAERIDQLQAARMPAPVVEDERIAPIFAELKRATEKFPTWPTDPLHAFAVVGEEFGECQKEVLQLVYEPHKSSLDEVRKEAIQMAAMALRFVMSLPVYQYTPREQHQQEPLTGKDCHNA